MTKEQESFMSNWTIDSEALTIVYDCKLFKHTYYALTENQLNIKISQLRKMGQLK